MLVHSYYDEDSRVRREAETLVEAGREVDVYALRRPEDAPAAEIEGVHVRRLSVQRHQGAGLSIYLREYLSFFVRAGWAVTRAQPSRRYGLVQVHTLPDFLVFAALPLRLVGVPVLLDLHEAMPEFFRSRFEGASRPVIDRALHLQERLSIAFSTAVITVNPAMADRLVGLGVDRGKVHVIVNTPSLRRFDRGTIDARAFRSDGTLRLIYAGALTPTYEISVAIDALAQVRAARPDLDARLEVYGRGDSGPALRQAAETAGIADVVTFHGRIPIEDVAGAIAAADIGLAPTRRDRFTDVSLSTKIFEYAAMGKPVVATRLPMVESTFRAGTIRTYEAGDAGSMANEILAIVDDPVGRERQVAAALEAVAARSWEAESVAYVELVDRVAVT